MGLAVYGLFFTSAGDKIIEALRSDVADARSNLSNLRAERRSLDVQLETQRRDLLDNQLALVRSEGQLANTLSQRDQAQELLESSKRALATQEQRLGLLSNQVAVTIPARKQVICDTVSFRLGVEPQTIDLDRLLPALRWRQFKLQAASSDYVSWTALKTAFDAWAEKNRGKDQTFKATYLSSADGRISTKLSLPAHWETVGDRADFLLKEYGRPQDYLVPIETSNQVGSMASVKRRNPWHDIRSVTEGDKLAPLDAGYKEWLDQLNTKLEQYRSAFDYDFPTYVPARATYDQTEDDAVRFVRLVEAVDGAYDSLKPLCPTSS